MKPQNSRRNRKLIITACAAAVVILAALIGIAIWAVWSKQEYKNSFQENKTSIGAVLQENYQQIKEGRGDARKTSDNLISLKDKLTGQANALKPVPHIFNLHLLNPGDHENLKRRLEDAVNELNNSNALLDYQSQTLAALQKAGSQPGNSAAAQTALAQSWQEVITGLQKITPLPAAADAHQKLVQAATEVHSTLVSLPELTGKGDWQGFKTKQAELEARFTNLRQLAGAFTHLLVGQDKALHDKLEELQKLL